MPFGFTAIANLPALKYATMSYSLVNKLIMEDVFLAYLAGFIDGEGSIYISRGKKLKNGYQYFLCLSVNNTDNLVIEEIQEKTGGCISISPDKRNKRKLSRLRLYNNQALFVLERIIPFLRVKKNQAILAVDFQKRLSARTLSEDDKATFKEKISSFNQKGR